MIRWLVLFILLWPLAVNCQGIYNNWYFGFNAGLVFNGGNPVPLNNNAISTDEGCATISDANGNLLFYTNGERVINRNHVQMPNGWGLQGHFSSSQSSLIVKDPADDSLYYIFTTPAGVGFFQPYSGLSYSKVDMRADNTLGDVIQKNINLVDSVCEKLTAVPHRNKKDVWVVVKRFNSNAFYAYLVTCEGVQAPVISNTGRAVVEDVAGIEFPSTGCMRLSPDGKKIAITWSQLDDTFNGTAYLDVCDFNDETGVISNAVMMENSGPNLNIRGYGVCFSPSGRYLYQSQFGLVGGIGHTSLWQYDMQAPDIFLSRYPVATGFQAFGTIQNAPDGKLYIARLNGATYLSRILFPENAGAACGFDEPGVSCSPGISTWGLPNNWDFRVEEEYEIFEWTDSVVCGGQSIELDATYPSNGQAVTYLWNTGFTNAVLNADESGMYSVEIVLPCDTIRDTVYITVSNTLADLGDDIVACDDEEIFLVSKQDSVINLWSDGNTGDSLHVMESGIYWLMVTDTLGCMVSDTVNVLMQDCNCTVYVPNAVTPNSDGKNEFFKPVSECLFLSYNLKIFNRWGSLVLSTSDPLSAWSPSADSPEDLYVWQLDYSWFNGEKTRKESLMGRVLLLR